MKLLMHVLKENKKFGIDNRNIGYKDITEKLEEEFREVLGAINNYSTNKTLKNLKEVIAETFDLIQVCILILWKSNTEAKQLGNKNLVKETNIDHKDKLSNREWIFETGIEIDVKE